MGITGDTLTFTPTDMNHTVMISAITDDIVEGEETFSLTLTSTDDGPLNLLTPDASVSLDDNTCMLIDYDIVYRLVYTSTVLLLISCDCYI